MCPDGRVHWRHLENTTEPSICGGDAVLCQITLTTCYYKRLTCGTYTKCTFVFSAVLYLFTRILLPATMITVYLVKT